MSYKVYTCNILSKKRVGEKHVEFLVEHEEMAKAALPGQFLHIQCGDATSMPLRRPISICDVVGNNIRFIFEEKGRGTKTLTNQEGTLDILGPLGRGFTIDNDQYKKPAVIGGGIGVYPLLYLTKQLTNASVYMGFQRKDLVALEDDFKEIAESVTVTTDDGSYGIKGYALSPLSFDLEEKQFDIIYACGPKPMLKAVKAFADEKGIPCQLSLEEHMGCGIGACLTCSCETPHDGTEKYTRVCKNGPVFWSEEVIL